MTLINSNKFLKEREREKEKLKRKIERANLKKIILRVPEYIHKEFREKVLKKDLSMQKVLEDAILKYIEK